MFKYENDIRNSLKIIRAQLPKMFHYEDCAILVKDKLGNFLKILLFLRK